MVTKSEKITDISEVKDVLLAAREFIKEESNYALGLALPQLGINKRAFVANLEITQNGKTKRVTEVFINPLIEITNKKKIIDVEGCLSLKEEHYMVSRPRAIKVTYRNIEGKVKMIQLKGLNARVVLHENDHLNGILIDQTGTKIEK